MKILDDYQKF